MTADISYMIYDTKKKKYYSRGVVNITYNKNGKVFNSLDRLKVFMDKRSKWTKEFWEIHKVQITTSVLKENNERV